MEINKTEYPHQLNEYPLFYGMSIGSLGAAAFVFWILGILKSHVITCFGLSLGVAYAFSYVQKNMQRNFFYFLLSKEKILDWVKPFLKSKELFLQGKKEKKSKKKYFTYELELEDLDQFTSLEIKNLILQLKNSLNTFSDEKGFYYKIYHMQSLDPVRTFLVTNDESFSMSGMGFKIKKEFINFSDESDVLSSIFDGLDKRLPFSSFNVIDKNYAKINNKFWRFVNVYKMSDSDLFQFQNYGLDYFLCFKKEKAEVIKGKSKAKRRMHLSNMHSNMRALESERAYTQNEQLIEDIIDGRQSGFYVEAWFVVKADTIDELNIKSKDLCRMLINDGYTPLQENVAITRILKSMRLEEKPLFKRVHFATSDILINFFPLSRCHLYADGISFYSRGGKEIKFNLFSSEVNSYSAIISGGLGEGKSVFGNKLIKENIERGAKAIILDLGNSFRKTTLYYGGVQFSQKFNPFAFKDPTYLKEVIKSVIPEKEMTELQEGLIFGSVRDTINNKDPKSFKELLVLVQEETKILILPYFEEIFNYFTDDPVDSYHNLIYVDTTIYPKKIQAPLVLFLIEYFKHLKGDRIFLFDECWDVLKKHSEFVAACFRTFRKHRAAAIAITQRIDDFSKYPFGQDILDLSYHKFVYNQFVRNESFDEFDKSRVSELRTVKREYSELYYKSQNKRKIFRYYPTPLEYELFTSDKLDNEQIDLYIDESLKYFSYKDSIERWVKFKYGEDALVLKNKGDEHE